MSASLFLPIFLAYVGAMIGLSMWLARKQKSGEDFLLGNRNIPFLLTLGTTVATMVGTGSSMGAIGKGYSDGWAGSLYGIGGALGILLLAKMFASARRHKFMTFAEEISFYYGANKHLKGIVAILILLASVGWLGAHILGGGLYLSWIAKIPLTESKIIVALAFGSYVLIGGYLAVVWTDTLQAIVLFIGFILMAGVCIDRVGGLGELQASLDFPALYFLQGQQLVPSISLAFVIFVGVLATPAYRQRIYSSNSIKNIKRSFYQSGVLYLFFSFIPAIIGITAHNLNPGLENSNFAFPFMATEVFPLSIGVIVLIAGLSATMSSASSDAIAGVAILLRDVFILFAGQMPNKEYTVIYARWAVLAITCLALICTLFASDIIVYIKYMVSLVMSGLFVCVIMGKYWKRSTWQGGVATLLGGAICSLIIMNNPSWDTYWGNPVIPAVITATIAGILTSLMTPPSQISSEKAVRILEDERKIMEMG